MARVIQQPRVQKRGRPPTYDWPKLLDGKWRRLTRSDDFPTVANAHNFRMMVYTAAGRLGRGAHVFIVDTETVELRGYTK